MVDVNCISKQEKGIVNNRDKSEIISVPPDIISDLSHLLALPYSWDRGLWSVIKNSQFYFSKSFLSFQHYFLDGKQFKLFCDFWTTNPSLGK